MIPDAEATVLDLLLLWSWHQSISEADAGSDITSRKWSRIMKAIKSRPGGVAMFPLCCSEHWPLLVLEMKLKTLRYCDSLKVEEPGCRTCAARIVQELKKEGVTWFPDMLPERVNSVQQCFFCSAVSM